MKTLKNSTNYTISFKTVHFLLLHIDEAQLRKLRDRKQGEVPVAIIDKGEVKTIIYEIRLKGIKEKIEFRTLCDEVFDDYDDKDTITIYELSRLLSRRPLEVAQDTFKFARYLIEPRNEPTIVLNKMKEEKVKTVDTQLKATIGEYTLFDKETKSKLWKSIIEVIL